MMENGKSYTAIDFSKEKIIIDESKYERSDAKGKSLEEEISSVSFFTLFRFASTTDKIYIFLAIISSIICGCTTPINTLLFSSFLQSMVNYGTYNSENHSQPDDFLREVRDLVIYSSVVGAVIVILSYAATVLMNIAAFNQVYRIRQEYLKSALNQDFQFFDTQTGDFASKMTDHVFKLEDGIGEKLASFIFYQTSFISSIVMALVKGLHLALLCLILFPIPLFFMGIVDRVASRLSNKDANASGKADSLAEEVLFAIRTVFAFDEQHKETEKYEKYLTEAREINIKKDLFNGLAMGTLFFCIFGAYAVSFWFGYKFMVVEPETYDVETMIAVIFGIIMGSSNFGISLTLMEVFRNAREAGIQIFKLINNIPTIAPLLNTAITPETIEGNIELKNVVFHYTKNKIYVFKSGEVVESGNHEELLIKKGLYYNMIMLQASTNKNEKDQVQKLEGTVSVLSEKDRNKYVETRLQENANATDDPKILFLQVLKLYAPEWKSITAASICSFVSGFSMPILAVILADLIGILSNSYRDIVTAQVLRYSLMIFGVGIFSGLTNFIRISMYGVAGECLTTRLRKQVFEKNLQQEIRFDDDENNSAGALCARLSGETADFQKAMGQKIGTVLQAVGTFIFSLGVSLYYEARLGCVALAFIPFMAALLYKQDRILTAKSSDTAKLMESSSKIAVEAVANVHTVAALGCAQSLVNDYTNQFVPELKAAKRNSHRRGIVLGLSRGLYNFMYAAILYYGSILMVYHGVGYDIILSSAQFLLMGSSSAAKAFSFAPNFQKRIKTAGQIIILSRNSKIIDPLKPATENIKGTGEASIQNVHSEYI